MFKSISLLWSLVKPHLAPQRNLMLLAVLLTACATVCSLTASWQLKGLIDLPKPGGNLQAFLSSVATVGAIYLAAFVFWAGQQMLAAIVTERVFIDVKTRLVMQLLDQPRSLFDETSDADLCGRLEGNLRAAAVAFRDDVVAGLFEMMFILGIVCTVMVVNWKIGFVTLAGLLMYTLIVKLMGRPWVQRATQVKKAVDSEADVFLDILAAAKDIRVFNLRSSIRQHFARAATHHARVQIALARFAAPLKSFFVLTGAVAVLALVATYGTLIIRQDSSQDAKLTAGELLVMLAILTILLNTVNQLLIRVGRLIASQPWVASVVVLMQAPPLTLPHASAQPGHQDLIPDQPRIDFLNISYSRTPGTQLLQDFTMQIAAGEKVALMGATGSGKSMLLDMLMRLREPDEGTILYSGIDIRHIEPALYYSAFGFVGQQSHVMSVSLRAFLQQGWPGQTDDDLWRVLRLLKLDNTVRGLPQQMDTPVGFYGWGLSNSQRQRLAVARALLRDPQVLVLDDFTATLDPLAELELMRDVLAFSPKRTIICTTYSAAVSALFDRVVELRASR